MSVLRHMPHRVEYTAVESLASCKNEGFQFMSRLESPLKGCYRPPYSRSGGMADAMDSKSIVPKGRVGSSPTFGTVF